MITPTFQFAKHSLFHVFVFFPRQSLDRALISSALYFWKHIVRIPLTNASLLKQVLDRCSLIPPLLSGDLWEIRRAVPVVLDDDSVLTNLPVEGVRSRFVVDQQRNGNAQPRELVFRYWRKSVVLLRRDQGVLRDSLAEAKSAKVPDASS